MDVLSLLLLGATAYALSRREPVQVWANVETGAITVLDPPSAEAPPGSGWRPASQYEIGLLQAGAGPPYAIPEFFTAHPELWDVGPA